jgi:hypothetical protein
MTTRPAGQLGAFCLGPTQSAGLRIWKRSGCSRNRQQTWKLSKDPPNSNDTGVGMNTHAQLLPN